MSKPTDAQPEPVDKFAKRFSSKDVAEWLAKIKIHLRRGAFDQAITVIHQAQESLESPPGTIDNKSAIAWAYDQCRDLMRTHDDGYATRIIEMLGQQEILYVGELFSEIDRLAQSVRFTSGHISWLHSLLQAICKHREQTVVVKTGTGRPRSQVIRELLVKHPEMRNKDVAAMATEICGQRVTPTLVSVTKNAVKKKALRLAQTGRDTIA